jgi:hypothetical protein
MRACEAATHLQRKILDERPGKCTLFLTGVTSCQRQLVIKPKW